VLAAQQSYVATNTVGFFLSAHSSFPSPFSQSAGNKPRFQRTVLSQHVRDPPLTGRQTITLNLRIRSNVYMRYLIPTRNATKHQAANEAAYPQSRRCQNMVLLTCVTGIGRITCRPLQRPGYHHYSPSIGVPGLWTNPIGSYRSSASLFTAEMEQRRCSHLIP
jgi:hypothetical protein